MNNRCSIRISISSGEIEIEGTNEFVEKYSNHIEKFIRVILEQSHPYTKTKLYESSISGSIEETNEIPKTFGEYYSLFPRSIKDIDKMLIASFYAQSVSEEKMFTTAEAGKLLTEQGIKISNPSQRVRDLRDKKDVFTIGRGKFRISEQGERKLHELKEATE